MTSSQPTLPRKLLFSGLTLIVVLVLLEVTSLVAYRVALGSWFAYGADSERRALLRPPRDEAPEESPKKQRVRVPASGAEERLHPFIGFVHDFPGAPGGFLQTTPWGFLRRSADPPIPENAYRIGVVGGSAAFLFSFKGSARLIEGLRDAPFVDGRPVHVTSLALGGFKQPQQLMTVAWLLSVGERFDLIVNLDGYNEVAFGLENSQRGVYPAYPRNWSLRVGGSETLEELAPVGRAAVWTDWRRRLAVKFDSPVAARTVTGNLVWRLLDRAVVGRIQRAEADITASTREELGYAAAGPPGPESSELYPAVADYWRQSSIQLDRLCRANGIRYIHLLQPNQYVAGSKPMGEKERAVAIQPGQLRRGAVEEGYPILLAEAGELLAAGVDFHDLTQIYSQVHEAVYEDSCCHVNQLGNELIADYLVAALRAGPAETAPAE